MTSQLLQSRDALLRNKWTGSDVEEIIPHAREVLSKYTVGATESIVRAYAEAISTGAPFDLP